MCIRVHPWPNNQTSKADRTPKKTSDLATDGHGYTRMRSASFLALDREKIGPKLYGYVLAKRYTSHSKHSRSDSLSPQLSGNASRAHVQVRRHKYQRIAVLALLRAVVHCRENRCVLRKWSRYGAIGSNRPECFVELCRTDTRGLRPFGEV